MIEIPIYQLDAFTLGPEHPFSGNPAAVCLLDSWLDDSVMQAIAAENNLSETAFCVSSQGHHELRWFTPKAEVPLCGHATLATAFVLFDTGRVETEAVFETKSGTLTVKKSLDRLSMDFPAQETAPCAVANTLCQALNAAPTFCRMGDTDYVAIFDHESDIETLAPDRGLVEALDRPGLIATAPGEGCDFVSRYFAPAKGVDEDPVTGRAHCVLAPYWAERLGQVSLSACQLSTRGGAVDCIVRDDRVQLSGRVKPYMQGMIRL